MGDYSKSKEIVLLFDYYSTESKDLHKSFQLAGKDYPAVVIEEDGFLPEGVTSVYGFFLGDFKNAKNIPGKPRYFNQITVPDYWEISANNSSGKIHDLNKERGRIFFAEPKNKRLVKIVDWCDERGIVRSSDHYNRYGALYARTIFNAKGQKVNKAYFSVDGKEVIVENFVTGDIILNDGDVVKVFRTKTDFVLYFMEKAGFAQSRIYFNSLSTPFFVSQRMSSEKKEDVLFWQEPVRDTIPGNMQIILKGQSNRTSQIMVQKRTAYDKLIALGASQDMVQRLGFVYPFVQQNTYKPEVLICTNSDRIAHCEKLIKELPEMHFHIAALTEMSSKLMSMGRYDNVTLYPGVKMTVLDELFENCDFYFDINYENEIVSAVRKAFMHNHLIFAFKETAHNMEYVTDDYTYAESEVNRMISDMKMILLDPQLIDAYLDMQHQWAMAVEIDKYKEL